MNNKANACLNNRLIKKVVAGGWTSWRRLEVTYGLCGCDDSLLSFDVAAAERQNNKVPSGYFAPTVAVGRVSVAGGMFGGITAVSTMSWLRMAHSPI
jgi:hypothetical protein